MMSPQPYMIERTPQPPDLTADFASPAWSAANVLQVDQFHPRSSEHRPVTRARLLYDASHLYVAFHVADRYVRAVNTLYQSMVCRDSCVEFFVQPRPQKGYFNFELNCGGTLLVYYVEDPTRVGASLRKFIELPAEFGDAIRIHATLPRRVEPEITEAVAWQVTLAIPIAAMEPYVGALGDLARQTWRANFYKCGDKTSHPHWASWSPIGENLNFHQPEFFGPILFRSA